MVKTQQQSVTQDGDYISNDYTVVQDNHNKEVRPKGCQKQMAARLCQHPIRWAFTSQALTRWCHRAHIRLNKPATHLSTSEG